MLNTRFQVIQKLREELSGVDVARLAQVHKVTISLDGKINKGWVGQTLDRVSNNLKLNNQAPDGIDFELKSVSVVKRGEDWYPKETIAITMFNPASILAEEFDNSHLWQKLQRLILVGHSYPNGQRDSAQVRFIAPVDVSDKHLVEEISSFWHSIREIVHKGDIASYTSRGTSKGFIQLRTKGSGQTTSTCPITGAIFKTRAFYATKPFIAYVRGIMG